MPSDDLSQIFQKLGEVAQGLRALAEMIDVRHRHAEQLHDLVREDLSTLRQDQRDLEEKLECVVCVVQHDLEQLRAESMATSGSVDGLTTAIRELRKPVADIIAIRARLAELILGLGVLGSAFLWLIEPLYRWFVEEHFLRR